MFSTDYYALVAGLREYSLDAEVKGFDIGAIRAEVRESVSARDRREVDLLYALYDCENIVAMHDGRALRSRLGRLSDEQLEEELAHPSKALPARVAQVLRAYADPEGEDADDVDTERPFGNSLFAAYYAACAGASSRFLREWSSFDRTLRNVVAATIARAQDIPVASAVVGEDEVTAQLQRSSAADFGLRGELAWADAAIAAVSDGGNLLERERKLDTLRWDMASELSQFDYFDINAVLAYLVKVNMVSRWTSLDRAHGREMFGRLMRELDGKQLVNKS